MSLHRFSRTPWFALVAAVGVSLVIAWPLLRAWMTGGSRDLIAGAFYTDRLFNLALIRTAYDYGATFLDPIGRDRPVFYQFGFHWLVGIGARVLGLSPVTLLNGLMLLLPGAAFLVLCFFAFQVTGNGALALAAAGLCFAFGRFQALPWVTPSYGPMYGDHGVVIPFAQHLSGPYTDNFALLGTYLSLGFLLKHLRAKRQFVPLAAFVFFAFAALFCHLLHGILFLLAAFLVILFQAEGGQVAKRRAFRVVYGAAIVLYVVALIGFHARIPMSLLAAFGLLVFSLLFTLRAPCRATTAFVVAVGLAGAIVAANLWALAKFGTSLSGYSEDVRLKKLAVPLGVMLLNFWPLWVPLAWACRRLPERRILWPLVLATLLAFFNDRLGYNNHPYRFIPYSIPIWCTLAVLGLRGLWRALHWRPVFWLTAAGLMWGGVYNVCWFGTYGMNVDRGAPWILALAQRIDADRAENPAKIYALSPKLQEARSELAIFTGARLLPHSFLTYEPMDVSAEGLRQLAREGRIDVLITNHDGDRNTEDVRLVPRNEIR